MKNVQFISHLSRRRRRKSSRLWELL